MICCVIVPLSPPQGAIFPSPRALQCFPHKVKKIASNKSEVEK